MSFYAMINIINSYKNMKDSIKNQLKQSYDYAKSTVRKPLAVVSLAVLTVGGAGTAVVTQVYADTFQSQINDLMAENMQSQASVNALTLEAKSFEDAIAKLQADIAIVENNIAVNQARQDDLNRQITAKQVELDKQRALLGDNIKAMYVDGQMSSIEMLATSRSIGQYVDSQTYQETMQNKIKNTLDEIARLQNQLAQQKHEVETLLTAQRVQDEQLNADRAQQNQLLAMNTAQRNDFNAKIAGNQDRIRQLQAAQAALNGQGASRVSISGNERGGDCDAGSGNGGYVMASGAMGDVCNAPKDSILDWAGIENRECTSYAYWYFKRVAGNTDFTASGDAKYWVKTSNYPVRDWPAVNAIGVKTEGQWGHVTIVQAVGPTTFKGVNVPAGQVLTSEMNSDFTGKFSYNLRGVSTMKYIYK